MSETELTEKPNEANAHAPMEVAVEEKEVKMVKTSENDKTEVEEASGDEKVEVAKEEGMQAMETEVVLKPDIPEEPVKGVEEKAVDCMEADAEPAEKSTAENVAITTESDEVSKLEEKSQGMDKRMSTLSKDIQLAKRIRGEDQVEEETKATNEPTEAPMETEATEPKE